MLGGAELAWDAVHGTPLRAAVYARGDSSPVLELKVTDISFGAVSRSVFDVVPPSGTKVTNLTSGRAAATHRNRGATALSGLAAVQRHASFPGHSAQVAHGAPRGDVRLVSSGSHSGALVTYGHGLGGIAVLETPADGKAGLGGPPQAANGEQPGLQLPRVSIHGADAASSSQLRWARRSSSSTTGCVT